VRSKIKAGIQPLFSKNPIFMFNWFKNRKTKKDSISITITGVNPTTDNEFLFYDFVSTAYPPHLEKWFQETKKNQIKFKREYELAIKGKIKTGKFRNPHNFPEYFNNQFDYIAIDFETANKNRVSACAIGLVFIKDYKIAHQASFKIKPPNTEKFSAFHTNLHGIRQEDVDFWEHFDELWENELSKYLNNSLVIFHNASMELSVLKNLFEFYNIVTFDISYIDTMQLAEKSGQPKKLEDLAAKFEIEINKLHDPVSDARTCALIFNELRDIYPDYPNLINTLNHEKETQKQRKNQIAIEVKNDNIDIIQVYSISKDELKNVDISKKGFLFSGELTQDRNECKNFILKNGGIIKSGVTSKVDFVVIGIDYGWAKIQKVQELNSKKNCQIKILSNSDFNFIQEKYKS
jgi:DNA polymerase-3 subunit epsilon